MTFVFHGIAVIVKFKMSSYSIIERKNVKPVLVLSNSSSTDIILNIQNSDITAAGMSSLTVLGDIKM